MTNQNALIYGTASLFGLIIYLYLSSLTFFILSHQSPEHALPWSILNVISGTITPQIQSQLFVAFGVPLLAAFTLAGLLRDSMPGKDTFGNARWATLSDMRKAKLLKKSGLILGKFQGKYLISDAPTHAIIVAPTRSGKGVGIVVPNLLAWQGSVICLDVKHENYRKTAGFRKEHGQKVFMWAPLDENARSHRYNPLDMVSKNPYQRISDLQIIGNILIQTPPKSDPVWVSEARALFVGLALYVIDNKEMHSTIGAINRLLGTEADLGDICRHIIKTHPEIAGTVKKSLLNFANKAAKERSGVKSSLNQAINLWDNPLIDAATSTSDFSLEDLRKEKTSIYVGVLTGQIQTLTPLLRIFFEQVITKLSLKEPDESEPHQVLLMLDEFHMLGKIDAMTSAFTLLAGYNCRVMAVVQSLNWLDETYGHKIRNGILSCCAHQVFYATNDLDTASYVSDSCGVQTVDVVSRSQRKSMRYEPPTKNVSQRGKPLIAKHELRDFPKGKEIMLVEASKPVKADKIVYHEDKNFKDRFIAAPEVPQLNVVDEKIPEFNIEAPKQKTAPKPDPNQTDMFKDKPLQDLSNNLSDHPDQDDDEDDDFLGSLEDDLK